MGTNVDALFTGLTNYRETLEQHNRKLIDEFRDLHHCWLALNQCYEGRGASEFANAWAVTAEWFDEYFEEINLMTRYLEERTDNLRNL